jgi:hypothetical protein
LSGVPAGVTPAPATGGTTSAETDSSACAPSVEELVRFAHEVLRRCEVPLNPSKVARVARSWLHQVQRDNSLSFLDYLVTQTQITEHQLRQVTTSPELRSIDRAMVRRLMLAPWSPKPRRRHWHVGEGGGLRVKS